MFGDAGGEILYQMIIVCERCGEMLEAGRCATCGAQYATDEQHRAEMDRRRRGEPRFELGHVVATPGALDALEPTNAVILIDRHHRGDWGDVPQGDAWSNDEAVANGERILSQYTLNNDSSRIWVLTEWDRSATTVLLPGEY